jgi:hypothetical protein
MVRLRSSAACYSSLSPFQKVGEFFKRARRFRAPLRRRRERQIHLCRESAGSFCLLFLLSRLRALLLPVLAECDDFG